jgi:putative tributyrin esterase
VKIPLGVIVGVILAAGASAARAQTSAARAVPPKAAGCATSDFHAAHLNGKDVKFNVILPQDYAAGERRFPVLYLLHGFSGNYADWCSLTHIVDYANLYEEIIAMPEGANSWYVNNYADPKMQWEDYILDDFIPYVDAHYRTIPTRAGRAIAGLSMGGYGALFLALKHPNTFAAAASLSGVVASANLARRDPRLAKMEVTNKDYAGIARSLRADFGPASNPARKSQDPFLLIRKLTPAHCPQLYLSVGWGDNLLYENREFVGVLSTLKMPYRYAEVPGKHEWPVWNEQVQRVLAVQAPVIGAQRSSAHR